MYKLPARCINYRSILYISAMMRYFFAAVFLLFSGKLVAQTEPSQQALRFQQSQALTSSEIYHQIQQLGVLGRVLYVAAHPDDENTRLITWIQNEKHLSTAYISLTRGDGGQNLIGNELGDGLGVIRTYELLSARAIDRGTQFFSRARDFGYSKHPDETFSVWNRELILGDLIYAIRNWKPDVIITRFNLEPGVTHGHHTASAMLAKEAFLLAGDATVYPGQLENTSVWSPKRVVWNASSFFFKDKAFVRDSFLVQEVGTYNTLLGESYNEIAARSRSQHKSQGFGTPESRGAQEEFFQHIAGERAQQTIWEGIDFSWRRVTGGDQVAEKYEAVTDGFNFMYPSLSVRPLLELYQAIQAMPENPYKKEKLEACAQIIKSCLGIYLDVTANQYAYAPGDSVKFTLQALNRSAISIQLKGFSCYFNEKYTDFQASSDSLSYNRLYTAVTGNFKASGKAFSSPYWLENKPETGYFTVPDSAAVNNPRNVDASWRVTLSVLGVELSFSGEIVNRVSDPVEAEIVRPIGYHPPLAALENQGVRIFRKGENLKLSLPVQALKNTAATVLKIQVGTGSSAYVKEVSIPALEKDAIWNAEVELSMANISGEQVATASYVLDGIAYPLRKWFALNYNHIPFQRYSLPLQLRLIPVDIPAYSGKVAYIPGAGDDIPQTLQQLGIQVDVLDGKNLDSNQLKNYRSVVVGIRAFNTIEEASLMNTVLNNYVKNGGNLVIQYNTTAGLKIKSPGPLPLTISRNRVTKEDSPVKFLLPQHPVLNSPNKLTDADFAGWVQERGLYFPSSWDASYQSVLAFQDPGEDWDGGSLLVANYGKGRVTYTGISFFRELPAGVPGAIRLFYNLISP